MPDLDWFPTDPYRLFNLIKYDQNGYFFGWGEWMGVVGGGFWNLLLQSFTIFYIQIEPYRMVLIFSLKTTNKSTKWFVVFFLMSIQSSQVGLVLQNGSVFFWGEMFTDGFMC